MLFACQVNGAARIEALGAGGQILISIETHSQLNAAQLSECALIFLGRFPLKGILHEQEVVQVSSASLSARMFPEISRGPVASPTGRAGGHRIKFGLGQVCEACSRPIVCSYCSKDKDREKERRSSRVSRPSARLTLATSSEDASEKGSWVYPISKSIHERSSMSSKSGALPVKS